MAWLRLRPETAEELDAVDWRGQWKEDAGGDDDEADADFGGGPMESFDDGLEEEGDDDDEEEDEEEAAAPPPPPPAAAPYRKGGRGKVSALSHTEAWVNSRILPEPLPSDATASTTSFDTAIEYDQPEEPSNLTPSRTFVPHNKTPLDLAPRIALGKRIRSDWANIVSLPLIQS